MARQFLFDAWHLLLLRALTVSTDARIAGIAAKAAKEAAYHVERSGDWMIRLGDGTDESHARIQHAVDDLWMYTGEMFVPDATDLALIEAGIAADARTLAEPWRKHVTAVLAEATLAIPGETYMQKGGRQGVHTEHLGHLLAEMQFLQRGYPGARW
jgi:ring-1,2-phenylacetyl-CoA epoxidase subunit PaaC